MPVSSENDTEDIWRTLNKSSPTSFISDSDKIFKNLSACDFLEVKEYLLSLNACFKYDSKE